MFSTFWRSLDTPRTHIGTEETRFQNSTTGSSFREGKTFNLNLHSIRVCSNHIPLQHHQRCEKNNMLLFQFHKTMRAPPFPSPKKTDRHFISKSYARAPPESPHWNFDWDDERYPVYAIHDSEWVAWLNGSRWEFTGSMDPRILGWFSSWWFLTTTQYGKICTKKVQLVHETPRIRVKIYLKAPPTMKTHQKGARNACSLPSLRLSPRCSDLTEECKEETTKGRVSTMEFGEI